MRSQAPDDVSTIDLVVTDNLELTRLRRAMYSSRSVRFSHLDSDYVGTIVAIQQDEVARSTWLVRMSAVLHVDKPLKRARLKRIVRPDGESVVC